MAQAQPKPEHDESEGLQEIALTAITLSPTNPRKFFDEEKLNELAASIKEKGLIQPIVVRPNPNFQKLNTKGVMDTCRFELIAGERRFRASKIAGLTTITAIVRFLDDKATLEIQVLENLQRADLQPIEEAEGYKRLMDEHGYTVDMLAERCHKSKSFIYGKLKLAELPDDLKEKVSTGVLDASKAELLARIPNERERKKAADEVLAPTEWGHEPMPVRKIKELLERKYMIQLKGSIFDQTDATLVASAGACTACPKRSGNQPDFTTGRGDICLDPSCFQRKNTAHIKQQMNADKEKGYEVLKDGAKLWVTWDSSPFPRPSTGYLDFAEQCSLDTKKRSYKQLLETYIKPVVAFDRKGKKHFLVKRDDAIPLLNQHHKIKMQPIAKSSDDNWKEQQRKQEERKQQRRSCIDAALISMNEYFNALSQEGQFRIVVESICSVVGYSFSNAFAVVTERKQVKFSKGEYSGAAYKKALDQLRDEELLPFLTEVLACRFLYKWVDGYSDKEVSAELKPFGINLAKFNAEAKKPKKDAPAKKKKEAAHA
jgi:ParB/RepB/Spo0J family partition protein